MHTLPTMIESGLKKKEPLLWLNENWLPLQQAAVGSNFRLEHTVSAGDRLTRFAGLLVRIFPELAQTGGIIDSTLLAAPAIQAAVMRERCRSGSWLIKADHALPIAGSIKARGGIYEVLTYAESLASREGLITPEDDRLLLASDRARALFAGYQVSVGSTGNLAFSIGTIAAALGFRAVVHMSADAKEWKKARLRSCGVEVIEHKGDYGVAVAAGRAHARIAANTYFVDDESSEHLFLGYSIAALHLRRQLLNHRIAVDATHPLFVYVPCGVGGALGGITFGLRHLFGDHAHCFFAQPVASPCMLIRLAAAENSPISVREIGLDNCTEADGLAVAQASEFVASVIRPLVSGGFTVPDLDLFEDLYLLERSEGLCVEPSAAAGLRGPRWILESQPGQKYLAQHGLLPHLDAATHVVWTTGGSLVPEDEYLRFNDRGRAVHAARNPVC